MGKILEYFLRLFDRLGDGLMSTRVAEKAIKNVKPENYWLVTNHMKRPLDVEGILWDGLFWLPNIRARHVLTKERDGIFWMDNYVNGGDVLYDVGANIGTYTLYAAKKRQARVYAFEPEAANYFILNKNIMLNDMSNVISAYNIGIGNRDTVGELVLNNDTEGASGHQIETNSSNNTEYISNQQGVFVYSIDTLVGKLGMAMPDHVKIDIDGLEYEAVIGMEATLKKGEVQTMLIEIDDRVEINSALFDFIYDYGYSKLEVPSTKLDRHIRNHFFIKS